MAELGQGAAGATAAPRRADRIVAVAVRPGEGLGFRLAGVEVVEVGPGEEAAKLRAFLSRPEMGVVAVEERVVAEVPEPVLKRLSERPVPVLLPFSLPRGGAGEGPGQAYAAALVRRAIGYQVKLSGRARP
ncbi:V-type ATP synthase subunit F [Anaeromyxobacter paludicola]|uniref:Vacuolar H+transporting two-sector ATPase F subunit n=1 Tax=Anaeromyxobacter paludicola TaxID=2918171 RepID=A0ABN6N576_9BACT|nr:V-type ATP synthase subunit F [Anaeromyxobacter paludicola]BDG08176.1 hypothetical protein AMPC_12890 [Anaeromyxobacter paludicola]